MARDETAKGDAGTSGVSEAECALCHRWLPRSALREGAAVNPGVFTEIRAERPDWPEGGLVCRDDLTRLRGRFLERLLRGDRSELSELEREVIVSLSTGAPVVENIEETFAERRSLGERAADMVASFGGSWGFIGIFTMVLVIWMAVNVWASVGAFDPYPFILLNLLLSCVAAVQAPIIMMSQRRTEAKDRMRAENDYKVNLKAELEIRHLHDKIDHQIARQWERLLEIQRIQIEMLEEATREAAAAREAR